MPTVDVIKDHVDVGDWDNDVWLIHCRDCDKTSGVCAQLHKCQVSE